MYELKDFYISPDCSTSDIFPRAEILASSQKSTEIVFFEDWIIEEKNNYE